MCVCGGGGGGEGASGGWGLEVTVFWEGKTVGANCGVCIQYFL